MYITKGARKRLPGAVILVACVTLAFRGAGAVRAHLQEVREVLSRESVKAVARGENVWDQFDDEKVIGVCIDGHARAYPLILPKHVINDTLAGVPLAASY